VRDSGADGGLLKGIHTVELVAALRSVCDAYQRGSAPAPRGTDTPAAS
jgi:hypothetical protein